MHHKSNDCQVITALPDLFTQRDHDRISRHLSLHLRFSDEAYMGQDGFLYRCTVSLSGGTEDTPNNTEYAPVIHSLVVYQALEQWHVVAIVCGKNV
jgi:hypothetical protein